ncbi:MAG: hypothetical protein KAG53_02415 [Endozoicomonadaceae bacterium]|nr:hypothetical protein [Endozoicomonadaceae bacterium]
MIHTIPNDTPNTNVTRLNIQQLSSCEETSSHFNDRYVRIKPTKSLDMQCRIKTKTERARHFKICKSKVKYIHSIGDYLTLKNTPYLGHGQRGIFVNKYTFKRGEIITWFDGTHKEVSAKDKDKIKKTSLIHQTISINQHSIIICNKNPNNGKGGGYFANYGISKSAANKHNLKMFTSNTKIKIYMLNGHLKPVLVATRDIHNNEQLFIPRRGMGLEEAIKKNLLSLKKK